MILVSAVDGSKGDIATKTGTYGITPSTFIDRGIAKSITGAQTTIWNNAKKHTVGGTTYNDASTFYLDQAKVDADRNYTWYFDQFGNLIGDTYIADTYSYAVLKNIRWVVGTPGYAEATLIDMDGKEYTAKVSTIDGWTNDQWVADNAVTTYNVTGAG